MNYELWIMNWNPDFLSRAECPVHQLSQFVKRLLRLHDVPELRIFIAVRLAHQHHVRLRLSGVVPSDAAASVTGTFHHRQRHGRQLRGSHLAPPTSAGQAATWAPGKCLDILSKPRLPSLTSEQLFTCLSHDSHHTFRDVAVAKIPFQNDVHKWFNSKLKSNNLFTSSTAFYRCSDFCYKVTKNSRTMQAIRELFFKKTKDFFHTKIIG